MLSVKKELDFVEFLNYLAESRKVVRLTRDGFDTIIRLMKKHNIPITTLTYRIKLHHLICVNEKRYMLVFKGYKGIRVKFTKEYPYTDANHIIYYGRNVKVNNNEKIVLTIGNDNDSLVFRTGDEFVEYLVCNKVAVNVRSESEAEEFLKLVARYGVRWPDGTIPCDNSYYHMYEEETGYNISSEKRIYFSPTWFYEGDGYKVIRFNDVVIMNE